MDFKDKAVIVQLQPNVEIFLLLNSTTAKECAFAGQVGATLMVDTSFPSIKTSKSCTALIIGKN